LSKKALVHSGGSNKGSWACGVIQHLFGDLQTNYDIFVGTSVGAINASYLSQFTVGQEQEAAENLADLWLSLGQHHIYHHWAPFGLLQVPWQMSFYDSTPLQNLIRSNINVSCIRQSGKQATVGTVSLSSGKYHIFHQDDPDFLSAIMASCALPGMFCPIKMKDQLWIDGGVKSLSPIKEAILMGATEIDVITTSPEIRVKKFFEKPSIIDVVMRAFDVSTDKILSNDLDKAMIYNQLAMAGINGIQMIKLRIFRPQHNLIDNLLDFDHEKIRKMMELGYRDAIRICANYQALEQR
jgi:NTE family protein